MLEEKNLVLRVCSRHSYTGRNSGRVLVSSSFSCRALRDVLLCGAGGGVLLAQLR